MLFTVASGRYGRKLVISEHTLTCARLLLVQLSVLAGFLLFMLHELLRLREAQVH